jgi:hypothetical protein
MARKRKETLLDRINEVRAVIRATELGLGMTPALRDHIRDLHFIAHPRLGVAVLTDAHRERLAHIHAVTTGESMGWKPSYIGEEPNF